MCHIGHIKTILDKTRTDRSHSNPPTKQLNRCRGHHPLFERIKSAINNVWPGQNYASIGWMNGVLGHFYALSRLNWAEIMLVKLGIVEIIIALLNNVCMHMKSAVSC